MPIQWKPMGAMCSDVTQVDNHCPACVVPFDWKRREDSIVVPVLVPVPVPSSFGDDQLCCKSVNLNIVFGVFDFCVLGMFFFFYF